MMNDNTNSSKEKKNYFTDTVTIVDAVAHYNEKQDWSNWEDHLGITLTLDVGRDFQPTWYMGGSYKVDEVTGAIKSWGSVWGTVGMLFRSIGMGFKCPKGESVTSDNARFPVEIIKQMQGKEFIRLKYLSSKRTDKNGDPKWVEYKGTAPAGQEHELVSNFLRDVRPNDNGMIFVKDWLDPESMDSQDSHPLEGKIDAIFSDQDAQNTLSTNPALNTSPQLETVPK